jgi:rhodanese-related sulfurtransferase
MEELKRTKRITIAAFLFVIVLVIAFVSFKRPMFQYKITPEDMTYELMIVDQVTPEDAMMLVYDSTWVFVDVRSVGDYLRGHLENAHSIPASTLLDKETKKLFDGWHADSLTVVLYGNNELQASAPWMLLYQLGYTNTRLLMGGMNYIDKLYDDELGENETYDVEKPAYDYAGIISAASANSGSSNNALQPKKKVVVRKKKKKAAEGGC